MIYLDPQKTVDLVANTMKNIEELLYQGDKAVILANLARCCQLSPYGCGASTLFSVLRFFGKRCTLQSVTRQAHCDWEGTDPADLMRVLEKYGLTVQEKKHCRESDLRAAIESGSPVIVSTHSGWHYQLVYGISRYHMFLANPAIIGECGSLWCRVPRKEFGKIFDRWGVIVSDK
jgi:ABC-type bacteriocin/lantibiotic exporter with double-glycine peptidase domain